MNIASGNCSNRCFGDNGNKRRYPSIFNGSISSDRGKRFLNTEPMFHCLFTWPGTVAPPTVNKIAFEVADFPTLAGVANIPVPSTYGKIDGVSFTLHHWTNGKKQLDILIIIGPSQWARD